MVDSPHFLCRCEHVSNDDVRSAIAEGNLTINDVQRRSRAAMGICQGVYCVSEIARLLVDAGVEPGKIEAMTARPPTRLLPLNTASRESSDPT